MSYMYVNLKKKATVVFLCLISFTVGCIFTSQLGTNKKLLETPGGILPQGRHHLRKSMKGHHFSDVNRNVTAPRQLLPEENYAKHQETYDQAIAYGRNETIDNEYDYGENDIMKVNAKQKHLKVESHALMKPASKYHYFVEVKDPRAHMILQRVISKLPSDLLKSVLSKTGLVDDKQLHHSKKPVISVQEKWAMLINGMQELGYEQRLPTIINIGVKKSGTNAFGFFITQHPQITHSIGNEVHFFDWNYAKGIEYYRSRMSFSKGNQISFEKTPRYFVTADAPRNILKDLPGDVKFVICVRDPVERVRSEFRHETELQMRRGRKDKAAVRAEAAAETAASQGKLFERTVLDKSGQVNASNDVINTSTYSKHFKNWLEVFPRDRFYILSNERVTKDIYTEMKNVEQFLGLEPFYKRSMFYYNKEIHAPCIYVKPRPCPAKSTPGFLPKAEPSSEVIQKLRDFYRPYNQEFEKLAQMEFSWTNL